MKITMYELLGMVKNNKSLPKKIKYGNDVYVLQENPEDYATWLNDNLDLLNDVILGHFNIEDAIYLELEIIEEDKKIEKLPYYDYSKIMNSNDKFKTMELMIEKHEKRINDSWGKINQKIDYINNKD